MLKPLRAFAVMVVVFASSFCQARSYSFPQRKANKSEPKRPDYTSRVDDWVWNAANFAREKPLAELRKLAPVLGESMAKRTDQGQEGKRTVSIRTLRYDGLVITGIMEGEKFILDSIEITSPKWAVPNGLNVGEPSDLVTRVFGLPKRELRAPRELFSGLACSASFQSKAGRITQVSYFFFYD